MTRGFATLELLIAFAVLTISMTAVILVAFGNQSYAIDTTLAQRALYLTENNLETKLAEAIDDFDNLSDSSSVSGIYSASTTITDISECVKRIDSTVTWTQGLRDLDTHLSSSMINTDELTALGGDCTTEETEEEWDNPGIFVDENITGQSNATAIDEFNHFIYLTTDPEAASKDDFFIYEFDDAAVSLSQRGTFNTSSGYSTGLNDVDVVNDYAFVASASTSDQLQVLDISDKDNVLLRWTVDLPSVDPDGSYPAATAIYYYNDRVYVGTAETEGPEFHIFDVSNIGVTPPVFLGNLELTHNVNDIVVIGNYAYLATSDNNHELMVIDISNPTNLVHPDTSNLGYDAPGNHDGSALTIGATKIYLGRIQNTPSPADDFIILNRTDILDNTEIDDGPLGSYDINLSNNAYVAGIRVAGRFAFLALDDPTIGLLIYNIEDPANIFLPSACSAFNFSENTVGIDNDLTSSYLFAANSSNAEIRIIYDQNALCPTP